MIEILTNFNFEQRFKSNNRYAVLSSKQTPIPFYQSFKLMGQFGDLNGLHLITANRYEAEITLSSNVKNKTVFAKNTVSEIKTSDMIVIDEQCYNESLDFIENYIYWVRKLLPQYKMYYAVTIAILLGLKLDNPVDFLFTWSQNGGLRGKSMFLKRICEDMQIPIINIGNRETLNFLRDKNII